MGRTLWDQRLRISHTPQPNPIPSGHSISWNSDRKETEYSRQTTALCIYLYTHISHIQQEKTKTAVWYMNLHIYKTTLQQNTRRVDRTCWEHTKITCCEIKTAQNDSRVTPSDPKPVHRTRCEHAKVIYSNPNWAQHTSKSHQRTPSWTYPIHTTIKTTLSREPWRHPRKNQYTSQSKHNFLKKLVILPARHDPPTLRHRACAMKRRVPKRKNRPGRTRPVVADHPFT